METSILRLIAPRVGSLVGSNSGSRGVIVPTTVPNVFHVSWPPSWVSASVTGIVHTEQQEQRQRPDYQLSWRMSWTRPQYKNANIVNFILTLPIKINLLHEVFNLEIQSSYTSWFLIWHLLTLVPTNKEENRHKKLTIMITLLTLCVCEKLE